MDSNNIVLAQQTNSELARWQLEVIERLTRIEEHSKQVAPIMLRVDDLESSRDKQSGALKMLGVLWGAVTAGVSWHIFRGGR